MEIAYLFVDIAFGEDKKVVQKLKKLDCVSEAFRLIGEWDALIKVKGKNIERCIKKVQNTKGIGQHIILKVVKLEVQ